MISLYNDETHIADVALENGKLAIKDVAGPGAGENLIEPLRKWNGNPLTDIEVYKTLPHRLRGRVQAQVTKDEEALLDPKFFESIIDRHRKPRRLKMPKENLALLGPEESAPLTFASGGPVVGRLHAATGGRTDNLSIEVPAGAYVIPADIVSGMGEGNSEAGLALLEQNFPHPPAPDSERIPILAAGGEFVVSPESVKLVGKGDINKGHNILDAFVKRERAKLIKTLKGLPGPER